MTKRLVYEGPFTDEQLETFLSYDYISRLTRLEVSSSNITQLSALQIKRAQKAIANPLNIQKASKAMASILTSEMEAIEPYLNEITDDQLLIYTTANRYHFCFRRESVDEDKHPFEPPEGTPIRPETDYTDMRAEDIRKIQDWYRDLSDAQKEQLARSVFTQARDEPINE